MTSSRFAIPLLVLAAALGGCIPMRGSMPTQTFRPGEDETSCRPGGLEDPDSGAWSERDRLALRSKLQNGDAVVVSALGCRVEVLQQCAAEVDVRRTDLGDVVQYDLDGVNVAAQDLDGACKGATHVVEAASVGAKGTLKHVALAPLTLDDFELTGTWQGVMRQPGGPYEAYNLRLELEQHGSRVRGSSHLGTIDGQYWGHFRFEGRLEGNTLYFADAEVVDEELDIFLEWCMKGGFTVVDPRSGSMRGPWRAFACLPGSVELEKVSGAPKQAPQKAAELKVAR
jgi:hypothetical protein